jgi:hypothetical protein
MISSVNQKSSSFFEGSSSAILEVIIAALIAPIEVPATISNFLSCLQRALYTPHSYAPSDPPPCMTSTVSSFKTFENFCRREEFIEIKSR